MTTHSNNRCPTFRTRSRAIQTALAMAILFALAVVLAQPTQAQAIYSFTGGIDGTAPAAGLTMDQADNLYGTTCGQACGGGNTYGTVFMLLKKGSGWVFTTLYSFQGGPDGSTPFSRVVFGPDGSLYGTTVYGGVGTCSSGQGCGIVYKLSPPSHVPPSVMNSWAKTVLYRFSGGSDGGIPGTGDLVFDQQGNIYGTTYSGGSPGCGYCGVVFELTPSASGWIESVVHTFNGRDDGGYPYAGVIFDPSGNLYGVTSSTLFELTPSGSGWTENVLHVFALDNPIGGLIFDQGGNLAGTTASTWDGGSGGSVFRLEHYSSGWYFDLLHQIPSPGGYYYYCGPQAALTSTEGYYKENYYGTTACDGTNYNGTVFALTFHVSGCYGYWQYDTLAELDGASYSNLVLDADHYAYGTTFNGGTHGAGSVFKVRISAQDPDTNSGCESGR